MNTAVRVRGNFCVSAGSLLLESSSVEIVGFDVGFNDIDRTSMEPVKGFELKMIDRTVANLENA